MRGPLSAQSRLGPLVPAVCRAWEHSRVFGLASRPLCHETVFPCMGLGVWGGPGLGD